MLPGGLSMLWESVDPADALAPRFGFDDEGAAARWVSDALDRSWGIAVRSCSRIVISGTNAIAWVASDRGDLVVKWSQAPERFAGLEASARILRQLDERDVPVAAPIASTAGLDRAVVDGPIGPLSVAVLPELAGAWLDVEDPAAVRAAGASLAEVHRGLGEIEAGPAIPVRPRPVASWIDVWLAGGDQGLAPAASRRLAAMLASAPDLDDTPQLVHNDFRAANVLTRGSRVVAVLDFDDVVVDHRVGDLAKASVYLGTLFVDWRPTPAATRRAFRAGYESVRPLSPAEAHWYDVLLLWQGILAIPGADDRAGWASALPTG